MLFHNLFFSQAVKASFYVLFLHALNGPGTFFCFRQITKHFLPGKVSASKSDVGIPVAAVVVNVDMAYIGSQIFRPLPDIQGRLTVCVPDVQAQLEVWLVHPLINIQ